MVTLEGWTDVMVSFIAQMISINFSSTNASPGIGILTLLVHGVQFILLR